MVKFVLWWRILADVGKTQIQAAKLIHNVFLVILIIDGVKMQLFLFFKKEQNKDVKEKNRKF